MANSLGGRRPSLGSDSGNEQTHGFRVASIGTTAARQLSFGNQTEAVRLWLRAEWYGLAVFGAVVLGFAIRAAYVLPAPFPLNDGGLFYVMSQDLQRAHFLLPATTSYNGEAIPFAYPPLGFYFAGLLDSLTPLSLADALRYLPLACTCLTVPAFYLLARSMLSSRLCVLTSVVAFALVPRSFIWLLMGGGLTRSLGLLLAILTIHQLVLLYQRGRMFNCCLAGLLAGLTLMSHLEAAWLVAFTAVLLLVFYGLSLDRARSSLMAATVAAAVSAPWWMTVLLRQGTGPFTAAQQTSGSVLSGGDALDTGAGLLRFISTSEPLLPIIGILAFLGLIVCLTTGRWLLPAWWTAIVLLDVRAFPTFTTVPIAMMAGIGVLEVLVPALRTPGSEFASPRTRLASGLILAALLVYASIGAVLQKPGLAGETVLLRGLSGDERTAMRWVKKETPASSRFLVVPSSSWETAKSLEWFPALAQRQSLATVQGSEWLPAGNFTQRLDVYNAAYQCGYEEVACLRRLETAYSLHPTHVYIPKAEEAQCCGTLVSSLLGSTRYRLIYDGVGASIFVDVLAEPSENENYLSRQP